jgi:hypothetical protein
MTDDQLKCAVLKVGDGRGFVVKRRNYLGLEERIVITAAHCIERALRADRKRRLPSCHPARYLAEETYKKLLGPLGTKPTVFATCLFVDPIADIAVLGQPDNQGLPDEADAYDQLLESMATLVVADAPAQGTELLTSGDYQVERPTPGKAPARVLSLEGRWLKGGVARRGGWLAFEPAKFFASGMSGSPIIDQNSAAIGVVSVDISSPVILDSLSARLVRSILAASGANPVPIRAREKR